METLVLRMFVLALNQGVVLIHNKTSIDTESEVKVCDNQFCSNGYQEFQEYKCNQFIMKPEN